MKALIYTKNVWGLQDKTPPDNYPISFLSILEKILRNKILVQTIIN